MLPLPLPLLLLVRLLSALIVAQLTISSSSTSIAAAQDPLTSQQHPPQHVFQTHSTRRKPKRVAIIGGGAGGSSAAYFLSRAQQDVEITLFEKQSRLGGRSTTVLPFASDGHGGDGKNGSSVMVSDVPVQGWAEQGALPPEYAPIELGASIFVSANRNLARAAKLFNLSTTQGGIGLDDDDDAGVGTSIWDGQQFVYEGLDGSWWNSARMVWRYGYAPLTMRNLVAGLVKTFTTLYDPTFLHRPKASPDRGQKRYATMSGFPWASIEALARRLKFGDLAGQSAESWFSSKGVGKLFIEEIIEAATRVNYGQNTDVMHALGAGVSLAASHARSIQGGNWQLFDQFARRSGAAILHGVEGEVTGLVKFEGGWSEAVKQGWMTAEEAEGRGKEEDPPKWYLATRGGQGYLFDAVLLAAPFHSTGIAILNSRAATAVPPQAYVRLHVTLLITSAARPRAEAFGRGVGERVARTVLTTASGFRRGGRMPDFNSLSYLRRLPRLANAQRSPNGTVDASARAATPPLVPLLNTSTPARAQTQDDAASDFLVKMFSPARLADARLAELFGQGTVTWVYRRAWDAYPVLAPTRAFPPVELDEGLYYLNALEPMISTMETATVSARNAVGLLLDKWFGSGVVHGGEACPWRLRAEGEEEEDGDEDGERWSGWGCHSG